MAKSKSSFKVQKGKLINHVSITDSEFALLLPFFEEAYSSYFKYHTFAGKPRRRLVSGRKDTVFGLPADALFFILFYLKSYPTEDVMATMFEMSQPQVNVWKQLLQRILEDSFLAMRVLPGREHRKLNLLIKEMGLAEVIIDATERQIQRPKDNEVQKEYYSGKKRDIRSKTPLSLIKRLIM